MTAHAASLGPNPGNPPTRPTLEVIQSLADEDPGLALQLAIQELVAENADLRSQVQRMHRAVTVAWITMLLIGVVLLADTIIRVVV